MVTKTQYRHLTSEDVQKVAKKVLKSKKRVRECLNAVRIKRTA